jgi:ketol-acid reductoisomerase
LINQADKESKVIDENTKNDVKNAVKEIKKGDQVNKLCGILECAYQLKSDLNSLMQVENSSSIDHENLKKIAGDLESQVRAFEDKWNLA